MAFLVAFFKIPTFSENGHRNQNTFIMSGTMGIPANKMAYAELPFYDEEYVCQSSEL